MNITRVENQVNASKTSIRIELTERERDTFLNGFLHNFYIDFDFKTSKLVLQAARKSQPIEWEFLDRARAIEVIQPGPLNFPFCDKTRGIVVGIAVNEYSTLPGPIVAGCGEDQIESFIHNGFFPLCVVCEVDGHFEPEWIIYSTIYEDVRIVK